MERKVVLIVEDGAPTRKSIERIVSQDFIAVGCATFDEAVNAIDQLDQRPAALIVDVNLGAGSRGDGIDIAQRAQERFGGHIPTLVMTGSVPVPEMTERAQQLRAEFLVKPQTADALRVFLERAQVRSNWDVADVIDLDRAVARFAALYQLTPTQQKLLYTMMHAAERGERPAINENTQKAGLRRILAKTKHANFEQLRAAIKQLARGDLRNPPSGTSPPQS